MGLENRSTVTYGILCEHSPEESRVALTPDVAIRLNRLNIACSIESGAGLAAGFSDDDYRQARVEVKDRASVMAQSDAIGFVNRPETDVIGGLASGTWILGMLSSFTDEPYLQQLKSAGLVSVALERLPRQLSSAQSMDEMTSQNSVMGYKAALVAANAYGSFLPMMTTAAGTIRPAKVLVLGAGIAGLQAIGTAKRLGAMVTAYDVRPAAREEIESLGAKFLDLGIDLSSGQGEGGYARQLTAQEQEAQQRAVDESAAQFDIVITTAKVPGRKPPVLLTSAGVEALHRGAIIVDCAASGLGGNVEGSTPGTSVTDGGVTILGCPNLASDVASTSSKLLSRNLADTLAHFLGEDGVLHVDMSQELDRALIVAGQIEEG